MSETENFLAQGFNEGKHVQEPVRNLQTMPAPAARVIGRVNWVGLKTLYVKEVRRFLKVYTQTIIAPAVTTLMFMTIFTLALGGAVRMIGDVPYMTFLAPGLVMMAIVQNSFANTTSTMMIGKVQGCIVDLLMPPLSPSELTFAFAMGGVSRGVMVAVVTLAAMSAFVPLAVHNYVALIFFALAASMMLSLMGLITGIWADKFDSMAAVTNFLIMPLAFLSGTFYSVERLPEPWLTISQLNPFFYMIDGFRYAFIGHADGSLLAGVLILLVSNALLWITVHRMLVNGYKLKE